MFETVLLRDKNGILDDYYNVARLPKREDTIIYNDDKYEIIDIEFNFDCGNIYVTVRNVER